jgi:hypothetical protein
MFAVRLRRFYRGFDSYKKCARKTDVVPYRNLRSEEEMNIICGKELNTGIVEKN